MCIGNADRPRSPEWKKQIGLGAWPKLRTHFTARRNDVYHRISLIKQR